MAKSIIVLLSFFYISSIFSQGPNAELVLQKTNISVTKGKLSKEVFYKIQINNRAGEQFTHISIPYSKLVKVSNIEAFVKDSKGDNIRKLKKNEISHRSAFSDLSYYEDEYVMEFTLKHNTYPYTISYSYHVEQEEFLYIDYWLPILDPKIPTQNAVLNLKVPKAYTVFFMTQHIDRQKTDSSDTFIN